MWCAILDCVMAMVVAMPTILFLQNFLKMGGQLLVATQLQPENA